ncbi:hypothetical protein D0Z08_05920 [Nocardioides immobilis]|uniref:Putative Flp pilus-assembly TadG-like N-terminal domain-containing protein n=1 Tax=Nocardioides immobilis TaxID=2049295 RepID=A0A417Y5R0_9ACTN|nr:hypothetical protein [Nocardioides immobilis]RHW27834.1 hypothetical protein D0Z08_05920 [Nocardioides immobilis]
MKDRNERGAVAVFTAFVLVVLMGIVAIVVDLGMERVTRADLQALADVVALDLAREIRGGRTQAALAAEGDLGDPSSAVSKSAARNSDILGTGLTLEVDWGSYDNEVWNTATDPPSAVRVIASADTEYSVMEGTGAVTRTAFAVASSSACYRLGTFVAAIRTGDSTVLAPLNRLLGVNLDLVSYRALADADVTLGDLAATSVIGSPTQLLTGTVTYANLLRAMIEVLSNEPGSSNGAAISALQTILAVSAPLGAIAVGDVLHVSPTDRAALEIALSVLDIVGSARLATGEHFLDIDNFQAGVPGVGFQFTGGIKLISAAQLACGEPNSPESIARTAQLQGSLGVNFVNLPSLSIPGLATLQTTAGSGSLQVSIAEGEGQLVAPPEVHCGSGTAADPHTYSVAVRTQPASYSLSSELDVTGEIKVSVLQDLGLGSLLSGLLGGILLPNSKVSVDLHIRLAAATSAPAGTSIANLRIPPNDVTPVQTGTTVYLDPQSVVPTVTDVRIGGKTAPLGGALPLTNAIVNELTLNGNDFVEKTLVPLIDNINQTLIGPVSRMVGLRFGGADVYAVGAVCGQPSLWG